MYEAIYSYTRINNCKYFVLRTYKCAVSYTHLDVYKRQDPEKLRSIVEFPVPKNLKALRAFLGLTGYYRKFTSKYAEYTVPLLQLVRKNIKRKWDSEQNDAFERVKGLFETNLQLFLSLIHI